MEDETGQGKTKSLGITGLAASKLVRGYGRSLHSEGRGHRFESCRVHHTVWDVTTHWTESNMLGLSFKV